MIIQSRYENTEAEWTASSRILAKGEAGVAIDTGAVRYGNGYSTWAQLPAPSSYVKSVFGRTGNVVGTPADVGLDQVDNTSDIAKPVSAAQQVINSQLQTQIDNINVSGGGAVTKEQLGLDKVDNTHDIDKPVSTATAAALVLKAPLNNPIFTGNVQGITKSMVGLAQVDNTSDIDKPISTATQAALNTKVSSTDARLTNTRTPTAGSVVNASVAANAAISMDKIADSATRLAMTPDERASVSGITSTLGNIHNGIIAAGTGALSSLTNPPTNSAIAAIGPSSLSAATSIVSSVAVGDHALSDGVNVVNDIAFGDYALTKATSPGGNNIAMGQYAGRGVVSASGIVAVGANANSGRNNSDDIAVGRSSNAGVAFVGLSGAWETYTVASSAPNTAVGAQALGYNGSGSNNTAIGNNALKNLTASTGNNAIGAYALATLGNKRGPSGLTIVPVGSTGTYSWNSTQLVVSVSGHGVQVGDTVNIKLSKGSFATDPNIYDGQVRGLVNSVIDANSFTITQSKTGVPIKSTTDSGTVVLVSYERSAYTAVDDNNLAWGNNAGSGLQSGHDNLFVGNNSGPQSVITSNNLIAIGSNAFTAVTNATDSLALGFNAGSTVATATNSLLLGHKTTAPATATNVTVIGTNAVANGGTSVAIGQAATTGDSGVAIGSGANATSNGVVIGKNSTGNSSVLVGVGVVGSGTASVALGNGSTSANNSVSVGDSADSLDGGISIGQNSSAAANGIAIGTGVTAAANAVEIAKDTHTINLHGSTLNLGKSLSNSAINIGSSASVVTVGTSNASGSITLRAQLVTIDDAGITSDARDKTDVRDTRLGLDFIKSLRPVEFRWAKRDERVQGKRYHQGFIAQDVKQTADELGIDFAGYYDERVNGGPDKLGLRTHEFHAPMVKAIQELAKRVEYLEARQCNPDEHWT